MPSRAQFRFEGLAVMEQTRVFRSIYVSQLIAVGLEVGQATHDSLCERALYD